jgi:predicted TPR repeat methyltransferase
MTTDLPALTDIAAAQAADTLAEAQLHWQQGHPELAEASLLACVELQPENAAALMALASVQMRLSQPVQALRNLDRVLVLRPHSADAWQARGGVLVLLCGFGMNRRQDALQSYRKALECGGDAASLNFWLATLGEMAAPEAMPASVVTALFDDYAPIFDQHLVQTLNYRTPGQIAQALQQAGVRGPLDTVLDLGCGTGLCGPLLRPLTRRLVGVDLSPRMLDKALERGSYDDLVCADIEAHLSINRGLIDLIVAADVFIYLGSLQGVFAAVQGALHPGGHFAFSIEQHDGAGEYALQATSRYAHGIGYVTQLAARHAMRVQIQQHCVLRSNAGADVEGWVLVLQRD